MNLRGVWVCPQSKEWIFSCPKAIGSILLGWDGFKHRHVNLFWSGDLRKSVWGTLEKWERAEVRDMWRLCCEDVIQRSLLFKKIYLCCWLTVTGDILFFFFLIYWSIVDLQYCVRFAVQQSKSDIHIHINTHF